jgi:periplasmic protein TonB
VTSGAAIRRVRRRGVLAPVPDGFRLPEPPRERIGKREIAIVLVLVLAWGGLFSLSLVFRDIIPLEDLVTIVDTKEAPPPPPPPPPKEEPKPKDIEPPKPVPPDPDQKPQPQPLPPQPQFGISADGTAANGGFAVATGNTLMKRADTVVKKAPPPLPATPIQSNFDVQVVSQAMPVYPEWALDQGVEAVVEALITLDDKGKVSEVKFLRSGGKDFDEATRRAIYASVFKPLMQGGVAIPCRFVKSFRFTTQQ